MTLTNVSVTGIDSYNPAVDFRKLGRIGILDGKNFAWDASGVYSAFASRLVSASDSIAGGPFVVQTVDLQEDRHVIHVNNVYEFIPASLFSPVGSWNLIEELDFLVEEDPADVPYNFRKWTSAYLGANRYACNWNYGVFRVDLAGLPEPTYTRLTDGDIPGFPPDSEPVIAVAETNGRMMYLTEIAIYWSGPNAPEDLVPALGGAGFDIVNQHIGGKPYAMTPVSNGVIIWTETGGLVVEFIGGDNVFRFWVLQTQALPISAFAITRMPDDDYVILTRLGLFMFNNLSQPQPITPLFNEFLREYLRNKLTEFGHIWYSITDNRIYVAMRRSTSPFFETFCLEVMLDRWGIFNERHVGLIEYGPNRGQSGYVNSAGIASYFLSPIDSRKNREDPNNPGNMIGLGSTIMLGWIRAENMIPSADPVQELQEIMLNRLVPFTQVSITFVDEEFVVSAAPEEVDEGSVLDAETAALFDEGVLTTSETPIDYKLRIHTDLFDFPLPDGSGTTNIVIPELVSRNKFLDLWTCSAPSAYFRLQLIADGPTEYYRVNSFDMTVSFNGQLG